MKKSLILLVVCSCFLITGCSNEKQQKKQLLNAGKSYYNTYMKNVSGVNKAEVTLETLNTVVNNKKEKYNLSSLKKCNAKKTKITFTIKNDKIDKEEYNLSCK